MLCLRKVASTPHTKVEALAIVGQQSAGHGTAKPLFPHWRAILADAEPSAQVVCGNNQRSSTNSIIIPLSSHSGLPKPLKNSMTTIGATAYKTMKRSNRNSKSKKYNLSIGDKTPIISIEEAGKRTGVSTATIRNWIKTKYLSQFSNNSITLESLEKFEAEVSGVEKLTSRANKSNKDEHNHNLLKKTIISKISSGNGNLYDISREYEEKLSDSYRNKEGIYYTPFEIITDLFQQPKEDVSNLTFCDPCCGSGNFIIHAIKHGFKPQNIFAYDTDPVAIELTTARIYELTGYKSKKIKVADFLDIATNETTDKYDYIFTNPPWGKKIPREERIPKALELNAGASIDTCAIFFFACLANLKEDGKLGLLLPDSFFNIAVFEDARKKALQLQIERLVDYGKTFKGLISKAQAIVIKNIESSAFSEIKCQSNNLNFNRKSSSFKSNPKSILNFHCSTDESDVLNYLMSLPHTTLKNRAKWALGIVTGNNKKHIQKKSKKGYLPVFKGADITVEGLKPPSGYISPNFDDYQQVAPLSMYQAKEKLVYKFISSKICFFYDNKQRFFLNSANILVPDNNFPVPLEILGQYLSSDLVNWIFKKIFNTHKILRGDLESLPIYYEALCDITEFDEEKLLEKIGIRKESGTYRIKE